MDNHQAAKPGRLGQALVGSWRVTVNVSNPPGVPSFPVLMTFHADGTMLQSRLSYIPAYGVLETTHHGAWKRINWNQIAATTLSLAQGAPGNAALNGAFFGTGKVSFQPMIAGDSNSFTAQWTSTVFDPRGTPIVQGSGNLPGVRIQVALMGVGTAVGERNRKNQHFLQGAISRDVSPAGDLLRPKPAWQERTSCLFSSIWSRASCAKPTEPCRYRFKL